jgi:hypothetical protein
MSKDNAVTELATRTAATIVEAVCAAIPKGAKPTPEQWRAMMRAAAGAAFETGFYAGKDVGS